MRGKKSKYDFSGWVTRSNLECGDGRIIDDDAFAHQDGMVVPLVWNHDHSSPSNILGKVLLKNKQGGVYGYAEFNDTEDAQTAKMLLKHGDINGLSVLANRLKERANHVKHGMIREVSLVLASANPGAYIENVMAHGDIDPDSAYIYSGEEADLQMIHGDIADFEDDDWDDDLEEPKKPQKKGRRPVMQHSDEDENEDDNSGDDETIEDVMNTLSTKQKKAVYAVIAEIMEGGDDNDEEEEDGSMRHSVFNTQGVDDTPMITHAELSGIIEDAKKGKNSLKDVTQNFLMHADTDYGIQDIEYLFPDYKNVDVPPRFIQRDMGWVGKVMNAVHHVPFSRIKSMQADITEDEARAKGYIKGKRKKEEVFTLLKRTTDPQTIYKKQKLDRDDIIDITDFDVVSWMKTEMRMMLDEEIARAILIGDGRLASSDDKIQESHVRPIMNDDDLYSVKVTIEYESGANIEERAKGWIKGIIRARKQYKGSGDPSFFTTEDYLTEMLLIEDGVGRPLYETVEALCRKLRVKEIITVPPMEGSKTSSGNDLIGIMVNLTDYNVGADKGGAISMFEDFDIDFNQEKYLIETRISGALVVPFSALVIEEKQATTTP